MLVCVTLARAKVGGYWSVSPTVQTWVCLKRLADNAPSVIASDTLVLRADDLDTEEDK
jgi:hypothetical protein